ncbi:hypothetical protein DFJ73DRAFT_803044 [Zopfochytrium polystomum]|nr:hypothetical protein DFJ73DRAFT_803044 [Zopfochytrium polystomum]
MPPIDATAIIDATPPASIPHPTSASGPSVRLASGSSATSSMPLHIFSPIIGRRQRFVSNDDSDSDLCIELSTATSQAVPNSPSTSLSSLKRCKVDDASTTSPAKKSKQASASDSDLDHIRTVVRSEVLSLVPELARQIAAHLLEKLQAPPAQLADQILKPYGEAGADFNLQKAMGLDDTDEHQALYKSILNTVHASVHIAFEDNDLRTGYLHQDPEKLACVFQMVAKKHNYVSQARFPLHWPLGEMVKCYIRGWRKRDKKAKSEKGAVGEKKAVVGKGKGGVKGGRRAVGESGHAGSGDGGSSDGDGSGGSCEEEDSNEEENE